MKTALLIVSGIVIGVIGLALYLLGELHDMGRQLMGHKPPRYQPYESKHPAYRGWLN